MFPVPPGLLWPDFNVNKIKFTLSTTIKLLVPANPNRFALWWATDKLGTYYVDCDVNMIANNGYTIGNSAESRPLTFYNIGPMVGYAWYGVSVNVGPEPGMAYEVVYQPRTSLSD